jgi:mannosyltransferase
LPDDAVAVGVDPTKLEVERDPRAAPDEAADEPTTAPRARSFAVRLAGAVWLWPAVFMAAVGMWRLGRPELWQDELVTVNVVTRSIRQIGALLQSVDAVHGAYYLFMHFWTRAFGDAASHLRLPSALAMVGAAACVALLGERMFGKLAGLLGGFAFAVVPSVTRFAQEARSYAFVVLFTALATLLLYLAVERSTWPRWIGYAACVTAVTCLNVVAASVVAGHFVALLVSWQRGKTLRDLLKLVAAAAAGVIPATPVVYLGLAQATLQINWVNLEDHGIGIVWAQTFASIWVAVAFTVLAAVALIRYRRRAAFIAAVALVPPTLIWLASLGDLSYFFSKYLLFLVPIWAVLAGAGLAALKPGRHAVWALVPVAALVAVGALAIPGQRAMRGNLSHSYYTYPAKRATEALGYREAAYIIASHYKPGDGIIYMRPHLWWNMHDKGVDYYLPDTVRPTELFLQKSAADAHELYSVECPVPAQCFTDVPRVWIVIPYQTESAVDQIPTEQGQLIVSRYRQTMVERPPGMTVSLMQRK